jgi:hypothetical protein
VSDELIAEVFETNLDQHFLASVPGIGLAPDLLVPDVGVMDANMDALVAALDVAQLMKKIEKHRPAATEWIRQRKVHDAAWLCPHDRGHVRAVAASEIEVAGVQAINEGLDNAGVIAKIRNVMTDLSNN